MLLVAVTETDPVIRARRGEESDRNGGREKCDDEHVALEHRDAGPSLRERDSQEEGEQHRDARKHDPQLVQQLDQLAIGPFLRRFVLFDAPLPPQAGRYCFTLKVIGQVCRWNPPNDAYIVLANRLDPSHRCLL